MKLRLLAVLAVLVLSHQITPTFLEGRSLAASVKHESNVVENEKEAGHTPVEKEGALEQMGLKRYDLGIYTLIVFGLLFLILSKFAWKPLIDGLDKREALIRGAKEEAEKALAETQKIRAELEAERLKSGEEIKAMIDEARKAAEGLRDKFKAEAAAEIASERDRLRREIEAAKDQALSEIWRQAVSLATLISKKTVEKKLTEDDHRSLVDESLAELKTTLAKAG